MKAEVKKIPRHVAIIMDGNGRWAKQRGLPRIEGHRVGMEKIREVTDWCMEEGVKVLTLFAFSAQNWNRPRQEVDFLMKRFESYLDREAETLVKKGIRFRVIGRIQELSSSLKEKIQKVVEKTRENSRFFLNLAINYGGQEEIIDAVRDIALLVREGEILPQDIDIELFKKFLYAPDIPYPDLVIRTGGEMRISNFLLWQIAYAELWITPTFWPDFNRQLFKKALFDFSLRERRFGAIREEG